MEFSQQQIAEIHKLLDISDRETRWAAVRDYCQGLAQPLSTSGHDWSRVASEICKQHETTRRNLRRAGP
jgi:hypothetical protein